MRGKSTKKAKSQRLQQWQFKLSNLQHNKALHPTAYSFARSSLRFRRRVSLVVVLLARGLAESNTLNMELKSKSRITAREWLLFASPFPVLWLVLGLTVNTAVFKFWQTGQKMSSLDAVTLMFVPVGFTLLYSIIIYIRHRSGHRIDGVTVAVSAVFAYFLASIFCPIP